MRALVRFLNILVLTCVTAGCASTHSGGAGDASGQYQSGSGSCYNPGMGSGYSRDFSYGGRYVLGHNRQC